MKKIRVYLQAPLSTSDSLYYKNLIQFPPKEVEYTTNISTSGMITNHKRLMIKTHLKNYIRRLIEKSKLPILNKVFTKEKNVDLIHCAHCLSKNKRTPWIADFEAPWQFWISGKNTFLGKRAFEKICSEKNCKKILAWTEKAKTDLGETFPNLKSKIDVLTYAMPYLKSNKKKGKINLLFSGRYFYQKGGLHALEAIDKLTKKYKEVYGIFASEVPEEIKRKYSNNKKIEFLGLIPQEKLFKEVYPKATIFVYPGYSDTFGFGFIEAMNFGIPTVTVDGYARKEIVKKDCGFIIPREEKINPFNIDEEAEKIISKLVKTTSELIENKKLREKMSQNCLEEIKKGKFSIEERNKKLEKIYSEAIK